METKYENGVAISEERKYRGVYHCTSGPAIKHYWRGGQIKLVAYIVGGQYHNCDGPALTSWHANGMPERVMYYVDGSLYAHGVASCWWNDQGALVAATYMCGALRHRLEGPAVIGHNIEEYYIYGKYYSKQQWREKIMPSPMLAVFALLPQPIAEELSEYFCAV
jgi:hypothetical protein